MAADGLVVFTVATHFDRQLPWLLDGCRRLGITTAVLGLGKKWTGFGFKIRETYRWLQGGVAPDQVVLFTDAYDTVVVRPGEEILAQFRELDYPLVFSAEKNCYPDPKRATEYPACDSPWRFLNSGGWIGRADHMLALLESVNAAELPDSHDDQAFFTDIYLRRPASILLDTECRIFQTLWRSAEDVTYSHGVRNQVTGTRPCVLHANGWCELPLQRVELFQ